ncbi:hypothetical protein [Mycobacterium sp. NPDC050441]|uniref:hypothetical protein n=1 Tax=Mycobacterium sp. NPDC050441 TaxID=3155403 RepID=UPI003411ED47
MAGVARSDRRGLGLVFEQIAEVIDRQHRQALTEYALSELLWHCHGDEVADSAGPASVGYRRRAA